MKITILKFLISKKGFFDREKLVSLSEQPFLKICKNYHNSKVCKIYIKFLKIGKPKIQKIVSNITRHPPGLTKLQYKATLINV